MSEYTNNASQEVAANQSVVFTDNPVPCNRGFVRHRDGTGSFLLSGWVPNTYTCGCGCNRNKNANYLIDFGCNVAIPADGTVAPITLGIAINNTVVPSSTMVVTPAAAEQFFNVSRAINIEVWRGCCETVSVVNLGTDPITVQNANIIITRPDLAVTR